MSWLSILSALLSLVRSLTNWLHERKIIESAQKEILLKGAQDGLDAIAKANAARETARAAAARDPDSVLREDDGFKRKD